MGEGVLNFLLGGGGTFCFCIFLELLLQQFRMMYTSG